MSSNLQEEHDLDSISSINSENEKVDSSLINKILTEMKSEFNRSNAGDEEECNENNEASEHVVQNNLHIKPEPEESTSEEKPDQLEQKQDEIKSENMKDETNDITESNAITESYSIAESNTVTESNSITESDAITGSNAIVINKAIFVTQEEGDEQKPRLILTLRTSEENREIGSRFSRRSNICHNSNETLNSSYSCSSDSSMIDKNEYDDKGSLWESRSRRSLRSSSRLTDKESEQAGMKRSSRRFSKEQCRESVLQSAIARKEKSFSSLNQEEKSTRRGARSPRQSPSDARTNKPVTRSKSPKVLNLDSTDTERTLNQNEILDSTSSYSIKAEEVFDLGLVKTENEEVSEDSNDTGNINSASTNSQTSEPPSDLKPSQTNKLYTKTGKRRAKYYKGLKYSLTTGGSVKRRAIAMAKKAKRQNQSRQMIVANNGNVDTIKSTVKTEPPEKPYDGNMLTVESEVTTEALGRSEVFTVKEESDYGESSKTIKRKFQPDTEESGKRCREETVPSPLQGDAEAEPDKPESSGVTFGSDSGVVAQVGAAGLCMCNHQMRIYARTASGRPELYCQAVDSLDSRMIGCCNTVSAADALLSRPSVRVPFLVLCNVHYERLQRHNCCPGCGVFCTQGQFMQCQSSHQYHSECQLTGEDGKQVCPHCGTDDAQDVNISLGAHKYPVFFPLQKPTKKTPSAKMTFSYGSQEEPGGSKEEEPPVPMIPATSLILPSGLQVTSQGLPPGVDKDKFTLRNMYHAAKNGEAEKMVHMLASGLNPNHVFREWCMGSALHAASHGGHLSVVHLLVQAGACTDVLDRDQNTPLMLACAGGHNAVVKYLVKAGASVTFKGGDGMTALHLAAKGGNIEACHYLISNPNTPRGYIDAVDDGRWTPLVWAAEHKHLDVVKFLLEKRADPLVRDAEQNIALHWAALSGSIDISEALLNYGSDVNSTNAHADTPLHIAARQNAYECVILLLARGARVDVHNRAGFVPLDCVVGAPNDTYTAIKLNVELRNLALNCRKRMLKILTNDITRGHEANPVQCLNGVDDEPEPQDFTYVTENCFTSHISVDRTITSLQSCKCRDMCISGGCMCGKISIRCWYDDEGKLLPEFNFADPPLLFECNQACACNKLTCKNRVVQHGITARFQLFRAKGNKGWGVSTLRLIPKGSYVCEYIGEIISDCEADTREDDCYLFDLDNRDGETYCIDARRYGNIARFINHSCEPNLLPVRVFIEHQDLHFPRIAFFANKDIQANEELGFDYGEKFWIIKRNLFTCTCSAGTCKYSEATIDKTLAAYNRKLKQEENH